MMRSERKGNANSVLGQPRPQVQPLPLCAVVWVLRGKHSRKRAVGPGRKCRKKCMIQRKIDKIVLLRILLSSRVCWPNMCLIDGRDYRKP